MEAKGGAPMVGEELYRDVAAMREICLLIQAVRRMNARLAWLSELCTSREEAADERCA